MTEKNVFNSVKVKIRHNHVINLCKFYTNVCVLITYSSYS